MLVGLRKGWARTEFREDPADYGEGAGILFEHERLEAYQRGLDFMRWFHGQPGAAELSSRLLRQVDKASTSVVLNIAEANGRYASGDRRSLHCRSLRGQGRSLLGALRARRRDGCQPEALWFGLPRACGIDGTCLMWTAA